MPILNILSLLTKAVTIQRPEQASQVHLEISISTDLNLALRDPSV